VKDVGWVCADCRNSGRSKITALQSSLSRTNEELSVVKSLLKDLKGGIDKVKSDITTTMPNHSDSAQAPHVITQAVKESYVTVQNVTPDELKITTVINDINRRKNNVVISGLPETAVNDETDKHIADRNTFISICEEHLDVKPSLSHLGCIRLGKRENYGDRPRKLFVHLSSEAAASSILNSAKLLRRSDDPVISSSVFINPDLSSADAKLAFERRQRKRERERRNGGSASQPSNQNATNHRMNSIGSTADTDGLASSSSAAMHTPHIPTTSAGTSQNSHSFQ